MSPRVMFYVQHLLGIGHVIRALRIARALKAAQFDVRVVMGGMPVGGLDLSDLDVVQLPPVQSGSDGFTDLVDAEGRGVDQVFLTRRRDQFLECYRDFAPNILLVEAYPFGRRQMRFELTPLLDEASRSIPKPIIASSVRDILQENRKQKRIDETVDILNRYFDLVLVHGDARFNRLEDTFPAVDKIRARVAYTGIVSEPSVPPTKERFDVIVSAGGGAVGEALLQASLAARPLTSLADARWLVVTGPNLPQKSFDSLTQSSGPRVQIERFRADMAALFYNARVSISQCGYNTVADILRARCAAVVIPFAVGGETEQTRRANALHVKRRVAMVSEDQLSPTALAAAFEEALIFNGNNETLEMRLDGAATTASILHETIAEKAP
ncbi:MAG: hypothetical protein K8F25_08485 [Fimbriimonadaceae bacterium]|nr:hypothetical protein [Alphaproteobacteria bacterium]